MTVAEIKAEIRETRKDMKAQCIRKTSCFNGGLTSEEYRFNARLFELNTKLAAAEKLAHAVQS